MTSEVTVGGLPLPALLAQLLGNGTWKVPTREGVLEEVFGEAPDFSVRFYALDEMDGITHGLSQERAELWLGTPPNDIDPTLTVAIGQLGIDRPFALDCRTEPPSVRFLTIDEGWRLVAQSFEDLALHLGLS